MCNEYISVSSLKLNYCKKLAFAWFSEFHWKFKQNLRNLVVTCSKHFEDKPLPWLKMLITKESCSKDWQHLFVLRNFEGYLRFWGEGWATYRRFEWMRIRKRLNFLKMPAWLFLPRKFVINKIKMFYNNNKKKTANQQLLSNNLFAFQSR